METPLAGPLGGEHLGLETDALDLEATGDPVDPGRQPAPGPSPREVEPKFTVSPRAVAVAGTVFGVACLAALAVVADVNGADGLSTIALALSILAFAIQILVFTSQAHTSSQQMVQSERLNTQTRALLVEVQTTARSTNSMVGEQFSQLLRAFMDAAEAAETKGGFDEAAFEQRLIANMHRTQNQASIAASVSHPEARPTDRARAAVLARSRSRSSISGVTRYDAGPFPSEEDARPLLDALRQLSPRARTVLQMFGADQQEANQDAGSGRYEGFPPGMDGTDELAAAGFVALQRMSQTGSGPRDGLIYRLTERGERAARVLNSSGPIPDWAAPLFLTA